MAFTSKGDREILVAGVQEQMFKVDAEKGSITETVRDILPVPESETNRIAVGCLGKIYYDAKSWYIHMRSY